jgi:sec-independent protein translocase protein TatA
MGDLSIWHWLVVLLVVLLLFGGGKLSGLMGDLARGITAFTKTMSDDDGGREQSMADRLGSIATTDSHSTTAKSYNARDG